eukprot:TRINITY_DN2971_c0_g1_i2.p1 TRINITY_DN2971_c0_g1~~TRINITY_DN2971_c0_g1_i2.p1  ORF type:complete len:227 (-),score=61.75 TRINITY_DN2971_c0_g1_i2:35-664(-)
MEEPLVEDSWEKGGREALNKFTKPQLTQVLRERNVKGYSSLNKDALADLVHETLEKNKNSQKREHDSSAVESPTKKQKTGVRHFLIKMTLLRHNVWRTVRIPTSKTFDSAFEDLLDAFDFDFTHLYKTNIKGKSICAALGGPDPYDDATPGDQFTLDSLGLEKGDSFHILYDFGDNWNFSVVIEDEEYHDTAQNVDVVKKSKKDPPEQY